MTSDDDIELLAMSSFPEEKIEWLPWPFIPLDLVTMLYARGRPGLCKRNRANRGLSYDEECEAADAGC